ncbi:MAG: hypothetical protein B7Z55_04480 [Planctomycetales bacterium 12-60-4]|nr:MAG: hypothetical protein B7Z55_04480 [Planctomycetales bacterium 12-60-4]
MNTAPASPSPIPDGNIPRTNTDTAPARPKPADNFTPRNRTFDETSGSGYDSDLPRTRSVAPSRTTDPAETDAEPFTPPREELPNARPFGARGGAAPTGDVLDNPVNPGTPNDDFFNADPNKVRKPELPENPTVIPQKKPADSGMLDEGETLEVPAPEEEPLSGPALDAKVTTAPVIARSRIDAADRFTMPKVSMQYIARNVGRIPPAPRNEWSAAPTDLRISRH